MLFLTYSVLVLVEMCVFISRVFCLSRNIN